MRLRATNLLTILLLLASAAPPPRGSALLIVSEQLPSAQAKSPQVRGRNRIPSPPRPDHSGVEGRLGSSGGEDDLRPCVLGFERRTDRVDCRKSSHKNPATSRIPANCLRLRC
jgi:hypothetical protein